MSSSRTGILSLIGLESEGTSDFSVSPSPFGLDFGTSDLGLTKKKKIIRTGLKT